MKTIQDFAATVTITIDVDEDVMTKIDADAYRVAEDFGRIQLIAFAGVSDLMQAMQIKMELDKLFVEQPKTALYWAEQSTSAFADADENTQFMKALRVVGLATIGLLPWVESQIQRTNAFPVELRRAVQEWKLARAEGQGKFQYDDKEVRVISPALRAKAVAELVNQLETLRPLDATMAQIANLHVAADNQKLEDRFGLQMQRQSQGAGLTIEDMIRSVSRTGETITAFSEGMDLIILGYVADEIEFVLDAILGEESAIRAMKIPFVNNPFQSVVEYMQHNNRGDLRQALEMSQAAYNLFAEVLGGDKSDQVDYLYNLAPLAHKYRSVAKDFGFAIGVQEEAVGFASLAARLKIKMGGVEVEIEAQVSGSSTINYEAIVAEKVRQQRWDPKQRGIPSSWNRWIEEWLIDSGMCASDTELFNVFRSDNLSPWRNRVPSASSPQSRASAVKSLLAGQFDIQGRNALMMLIEEVIIRYPGQNSEMMKVALRDWTVGYSVRTTTMITGNGNVIGNGNRVGVVGNNTTIGGIHF